MTICPRIFRAIADDETGEFLTLGEILALAIKHAKALERSRAL